MSCNIKVHYRYYDKYYGNESCHFSCKNSNYNIYKQLLVVNKELAKILGLNEVGIDVNSKLRYNEIIY